MNDTEKFIVKQCSEIEALRKASFAASGGWIARPTTPRTNAAMATAYCLPDGGWPNFASQLERELGDENARMNHYRHKWQDAEREIQKLKDTLAALSNARLTDGENQNHETRQD